MRSFGTQRCFGSPRNNKACLLKLRLFRQIYQGMSESNKGGDLRDSNLAAEERPVPSQAEGDLKTVEEDLEEKDQDSSKTASSENKG